MTQSQLPPNYIDSNITGLDRILLEKFYTAANSDGGTIDEITLRGIKAVLEFQNSNGTQS